MIPSPLSQEIDLAAFEKPADELATKYGLPREVMFCKRYRRNFQSSLIAWLGRVDI